MFDKDSDYEGMIGDGIMEIVKVFSKQDHSGFSAGMVKSILDKLLSWQNLTPLTASPDEWMNVSEVSGLDGETNTMHQSRRNPVCFSDDAMKSYYNLDDEPRKYYKFDADEEKEDIKSKIMSMIDFGKTDEEIIGEWK